VVSSVFDRWRYPAALAVAVGVSFPALAVAAPELATKAEGAKKPAAKHKQHRATVLDRPIRGLHRTIDVQVTKIRKQQRHKKKSKFAHLPGGVSQSMLDSIAACESGGDPHAVSSDGTYRGKYQFDYGTWASVGGHGDPASAPEKEQDYRAALLYTHSGSSPWPVCG
jgi:soluble lytic murein transglycosylase-like protein